MTALINDLAAADAGLLLVWMTIARSATSQCMSWLRSSWRTSRPASTWSSAHARIRPCRWLGSRAQPDHRDPEHALRFNVEEGGAFFNRTMGLSLSPESVATLLSRTEGWITGLQLAGVALRQPAGRRASPERDRRFVAAFPGADRYMVDYLMAEVLERNRHRSATSCAGPRSSIASPLPCAIA